MRYQAVSFIIEYTSYLTGIISTGGVTRILYFAFCKSHAQSEDEIADYSGKMRTTMKAVIILLSLTGILTAIRAVIGR